MDSDTQFPSSQTTAAESTSDTHLHWPTHRLEQIKVGEKGVQLLVSTLDHQYDAKNVEGGNNTFQCIGGWNDASIQELGQMLISHRDSTSHSDDSVHRVSAFKGPGHTTRNFAQDRGPPT
ncbi:hypothetical protein LZ32DRAFT_599931 [Colletotrichum eremochloae]|nr:hypothetical protein LZ32DRAFT_599931 [Colletotrichum eremochloae]